MEKVVIRKKWTGMLLPALWIIVLSGCATAPEKTDPFFERWQTMAETNLGNSPVSIPKPADLTETGTRDAVLAGVQQERPEIRPLPKTLISLTMRQADIQTILRALAKMADLNILVKEDAVKKDLAKITVDFKKVQWDQVFTTILKSQGLQYVWEDNIIRIMNEADMKSYADQRMLALRSLATEPMETKIIPIHYRQLKSGTRTDGPAAARPPGTVATASAATASAATAAENDFLNILWGLMSRDAEGKVMGSISVDSFTNSIIVKATKGDLEKIIRMIVEIDKPTPQIRIKANIVETSKEMARVLGVQWGGVTSVGDQFYITPGGSAGTPTSAGLYAGGYTPVYGASGVSGQGFGINLPAAMTSMGGAASLGVLFGKLGSNILEMQLNALQRDSKLNILSSPSITTLDNQTAFTENGEKVPVTTRDKDGNPSTRYEEATMRLEITPHVIDGKNLKMQIVVKKDEVDISRRDALGNPYIIRKETRTSLIVQHNETIVISGLTQQTLSGGDTGIPWLKNIPILGWLVKSDDRLDKMQEVLIFITPSILPPLQAATRAAGIENNGKTKIK
jgi:type IV pilus assembly protein PilQ